MNYIYNDKEMSAREIKALNQNVSYKDPIQLGAVAIMPTPKPECNDLQQAIRDGVEIDTKGNTVEKWSVRDMFSDYTNDDGVIVTKIEQETEYLAKKQAEALSRAKEEMMKVVEDLIQSEITKYNEANMVAFKNIDACAKYTNIPTYTHYQFCIDVITWQTEVWETARKIQSDVLSGLRTMPTIDEFVAELPKLEG